MFSMTWSQWHFDTSSLTKTVTRLYAPFSIFINDPETTFRGNTRDADNNMIHCQIPNRELSYTAICMLLMHENIKCNIHNKKSISVVSVLENR